MAVGVLIGGAGIGRHVARPYGRGYLRFGAAVGFWLASLVVFVGGYMFMGIVAFMYM
ncbi:hypothetical protein [Planotetraspora kaengkrachanensis]|nr:hypothetical protein [Planotetraspora kaengkrachanensis]